jgi:3-hydroxybutyryl-CoA dehydratase
VNNIINKNNITIDDMHVDMEVQSKRIITEADINDFAKISGDFNPIHIDEEYAKKTRYKKKIAHGLMSASFFSALFGTKLPGSGCVYTSQSLRFKRPIFVGDEVNTVIKIKSIDKEQSKIVFTTQCIVKLKIAIDGEAEIYIP